MQKYNHTLVLGRFIDFHKGHEALINHAILSGKKTTVLLCCDRTDSVSAFSRHRQIHRTFGSKITMKTIYCHEEGLSTKEESDRGVSAGWATWIERELPEVDAVVGSEKYIQYMDDASSLTGITYSSIPTQEGDFGSGTDAYILDNAKKIAFIGPESVGKTTAIREMSEKYDIDNVANHSNGYNNFNYSDMDIAALSHSLRIHQETLNLVKPILLVDSDALTIALYSAHKFGNVSNVVSAALANQAFDLYLVFSPEVNDGAHRTQDERVRMYHSMIEYLANNNLKYQVIHGGNYNDRMEQVDGHLKPFLNQ